MKPAREPASSRPKPCASLKKPHESCPFPAPCGLRRKKNELFSQKPPGSRFRFSRTGVQPSPDSSTIDLPSTFAESGAYNLYPPSPIVILYLYVIVVASATIILYFEALELY